MAGSKLTALLLLGLALGAQALPARSLRAAAAPAPAPLAPAPAPLASDAVLPAATIALTAEEVAKHTTLDDCWYIYKNAVYDVTAYMADDLHPAGNEVIIEYCGKDATEEFDRVHHSQKAWEDQELYLLGPLA